MALKNTYSNSPAGRSIERVQEALVKGGASGIQTGFDQGRIVSLAFVLRLNDRDVAFKLPVNWKKVQQVLKNERIGKWDDDDYAYRVSWAILRDWVEAQMAILASETVTMPQLFLPYAMSKDGTTLFDKVASSPLLLGGTE
jgi:hypothetical protein